MIDLDVYCDESHDERTYSIAGLVATPNEWDCLVPPWRKMLDDLKMTEFHAAEIVERENISDSRFKGWTFEQEVEAFTRAVDILVSPCTKLTAIGCSLSIPDCSQAEIEFENKDAIWVFLFCRLFQNAVLSHPGKSRINFMFDEKPEVRKIVNDYAYQAKESMEKALPNWQATVAFGSSIVEIPLQPADLFVYEWRKRISNQSKYPQKAKRKSYKRLREKLPAFLSHYGKDVFLEIGRRRKHGEDLFSLLMGHTGTDE